MEEEILRAIIDNAHRFPLYKSSADSKYEYDMMSDSIYWPDELPSNCRGDLLDAMRMILRYRTSVICQQPDTGYAAVWEQARAVAPGWIGFDPVRCESRKEYIDFYNISNQAAFDDIEFSS